MAYDSWGGGGYSGQEGGRVSNDYGSSNDKDKDNPVSSIGKTLLGLLTGGGVSSAGLKLLTNGKGLSKTLIGSGNPNEVRPGNPNNMSNLEVHKNKYSKLRSPEAQKLYDNLPDSVKNIIDVGSYNRDYNFTKAMTGGGTNGGVKNLFNSDNYFDIDGASAEDIKAAKEADIQLRTYARDVQGKEWDDWNRERHGDNLQDEIAARASLPDTEDLSLYTPQDDQDDSDGPYTYDMNKRQLWEDYANRILADDNAFNELQKQAGAINTSTQTANNTLNQAAKDTAYQTKQFEDKTNAATTKQNALLDQLMGDLRSNTNVSPLSFEVQGQNHSWIPKTTRDTLSQIGNMGQQGLLNSQGSAGNILDAYNNSSKFSSDNAGKILANNLTAAEKGNAELNYLKMLEGLAGSENDIITDDKQIAINELLAKISGQRADNEEPGIIGTGLAIKNWLFG